MVSHSLKEIKFALQFIFVILDPILYWKISVHLFCSSTKQVALDWFKSYLSNRLQCVELFEIRSPFLPVTCGVPQGSILGPLLFLIYVNDLPNVSSFLDTYLFADYTNSLYTRDDGEKSKLNNELNKLFEWIKKNEISLNISKTQVLQIHGKNDLTIELDGEWLFKQPLVIYLGIKIYKRFNFTSHVKDIVKKIF